MPDDERYVLDLCDHVLGEAGSRQHTFDWLLGDANARGRQVRLRVDAYYAGRRVVVEYRERQHFEAVSHFDKPTVMTISGVHRGEQRRSYDTRRDELIPAHGLHLWVITPQEVACNRSGRLKNRDWDRDVALVGAAWTRTQAPKEV